MEKDKKKIIESLVTAGAKKRWSENAASEIMRLAGHSNVVFNTLLKDLEFILKHKPSSMPHVHDFAVSDKLAKVQCVPELVEHVRNEQQRARIERSILAKNCEEALEMHRGVLVCSKCQSRRITINQKQSRAADEGMTLYCLCECGHAWKM